jgi:Flp pilus assembly protein TadD
MRLLSVLLAGMIVCGCTLPRIIVLNDPLDARQHNDLGVAYEQRGEYDLAQREYRRAAELDRQWVVPLVNLGNVQASQAAWTDAAATYQEALDLKADSVEALNNLAWVLVQAGRPAEALPWAQQAVTLAAGDPLCWDTLAAVQLALGQSEAARQSALRGLALAPPPALRTSLEGKLSPR